MYYCEPAWHDGRTVDAQFLILAEETVESIGRPGFSSCEDHIAKALHIMVGEYKQVLVREVNNDKLVQSSER